MKNALWGVLDVYYITVTRESFHQLTLIALAILLHDEFHGFYAYRKSIFFLIDSKKPEY